MVAEAQIYAIGTCAIGIITILNILVALHLSRVLYKSTLFMQNKPTLPNTQMNVSSVNTTNYEPRPSEGRDELRTEFTLSEFILSEVEGTEVTYETCAACGVSLPAVLFGGALFLLTPELRSCVILYVPHPDLRQHKQTTLCGLAEGRRDHLYLFMQNEPNLLNAEMNVSKAHTEDYENKRLREHPKNKPNSNPIKPNTNPIKAKTNPNKPNSNPITTHQFSYPLYPIP